MLRILSTATALRTGLMALCAASLMVGGALQSAEPQTVKVLLGRSLVLHAKANVYRTAVVDSSICEIAQFTPRELSIVGRTSGQTQVTFWFDDPGQKPVSYLIDVR